MKIIHYINNLGSGGAEKLLTDILPLMKKQGHDARLIIANGDANVRKFSSILKENDIVIYNLNSSFYNPFQIFKLIMVIKNFRPDIIHAHLFPTQYWLAFASLFFHKKIKLIKTEHSVNNERKNYPILRPVERWIYSQYDGIIGITQEVTEDLQNWLHISNKFITIINGVNLDQIRLGRSLPIKLELDRNKFNILMVGRFDGVAKDQKSLILALDYLSHDVHIYFAGEGPYRKTIEDFVQHKKRSHQVSFLGLREDIYTLMANVDLNVLSTNFEGLSGVTLESLASGKPFLGSDVVGVNNVVPNKDYLFPPKNPKALAFKINQIIENNILRDNLISIAQTYIPKYDIKYMSKKYLNYYKEIIANQK